MKALIGAFAGIVAFAGVACAQSQSLPQTEPTIFLTPQETVTFTPLEYEPSGSGELVGGAAILSTQPPVTVSTDNNAVVNVALNPNGTVLVTPASATSFGSANVFVNIPSATSPVVFQEIIPVVVTQVKVSPPVFLSN